MGCSGKPQGSPLHSLEIDEVGYMNALNNTLMMRKGQKMKIEEQTDPMVHILVRVVET